MKKKPDSSLKVLLQYAIINILLLILLALIGVINETKSMFGSSLGTTDYSLVLIVFVIFELIFGLFAYQKASIIRNFLLFFCVDILLFFIMIPVGKLLGSSLLGLVKIGAIISEAEEKNLLSPILFLHIPYIVGALFNRFYYSKGKKNSIPKKDK